MKRVIQMDGKRISPSRTTPRGDRAVPRLWRRHHLPADMVDIRGCQVKRLMRDPGVPSTSAVLFPCDSYVPF